MQVKKKKYEFLDKNNYKKINKEKFQKVSIQLWDKSILNVWKKFGVLRSCLMGVTLYWIGKGWVDDETNHFG